MSENINRERVNNSLELEIPSFMLSAEYERKRQRRFEEERAQSIRNNRYKLQADNRNANRKVTNQRKKQKVRAARLLIGGMLILVFATGLGINSFIQEKLKEDDTQIIEILEIDDAFSTNISIQIPTAPVENNLEETIYNFDYETRIDSIPTDTTFSTGNALTEYVLNKIENSEGLEYYKKYGEMYGIDPFILIAKGIQEASLNHNSCIPGGSNYNGYGVGISQLESPDGREIVAHNYLTDEDDVMYLTMDNAINLEKNIKMGAMLFQNCLERFNGNLYLAIQSYNYSPGMMNIVLTKYATQMDSNIDTVKSNLRDTGWLNIVRDVHNNPRNYVSSWEHSKYGDENYIENVLRYFVGDKTYYYLDGTKYILDFNNNDLIEIDNINAKII